MSKDQSSVSEEAVNAVLALAQHGEGVLSRHHTGVWSYPGAPLDPRATNLVMPIEHVSDAEIREALAAGEVVVVSMNSMNEPLAVRVLAVDQEPPRVLTGAQAGSPEAGTEVPKNYRPTHDAGSVPVSPADAARIAERSLAAVLAPSRPAKPARAVSEPKLPKPKNKPAGTKATSAAVGAASPAVSTSRSATPPATGPEPGASVADGAASDGGSQTAAPAAGA